MNQHQWDKDGGVVVDLLNLDEDGCSELHISWHSRLLCFVLWHPHNISAENLSNKWSDDLLLLQWFFHLPIFVNPVQMIAT